MEGHALVKKILSNGAFYFALFFGLFFIGNVIDNDTWFLLNCGRYVENFGVPHVEPFTMHEGWHYVMQQWLFALGLWKIYSVCGTMGLVAFAWIAGAGILLLFGKLVRITAGGNRAAELIIVMPIGCFLGAVFFCQRPQVASTTIFLIEILLLERYRMEQPLWIYAAFFALSALLVNVHAAMWPMCLVFLLPYLAEALFGNQLSTRFSLPHDSKWRVWNLIFVGLLMTVAGWIGPNGFEGMTYTLYSYGDRDIVRIVSEMFPLAIHKDLGFGWFALMLLFVLTALYARHPVPLRHLLLAGGTAFMALCAVRSIFLFLLFATFPIGRLLHDWHPARPAWTRARYIFCICFFILDVGCVAFFTRSIYGVPAVLPQLEAAVGAMKDLAVADGCMPEDFRIYTSYNMGNYFEFHGFRCFLDTRAEVFLPALNHDKNVFHEYVKLHTGQESYQTFLEHYDFDAIFVDSYDILWTYLSEDENYRLVWDSAAAGIQSDEDEVVRIYQRK